jgi:putative heme-binding domain-containing protein
VVSTRLGSETAAVESWIEENLPALLASGDAQRGAEVFRANCAVCHSTDLLDGDEGHVGPALDGMGAHGREHLLPFILRPNLSVEAAYLEYVAETVDGTFASGVLVSDAPDAITLAGSGGEVRVRRDELASLRSTGRSPMPTGFESLGAEALRDLLTFLCQGYEDYRILPLADRMSSTTRALYDATRDAKEMRFRRFGVVEVEGVPYEIVDPDRSPSGSNALVLKGGAAADWDSKLKMPQRVEVPVGGPVLRMHVLGGIAAWGHPFFGTGEDLVRWTWVYADGVEETVVLRDGHEFADWIGRHDVPGSEFVEDLLAPGSWGQVRRFHLDPGRPSVSVDRVVLESFDNRMAPTFLALTAQVGGELAVSAATEPGAARVLVVGGGSSHDFRRWFDEALVETLEGTPGLSAGEVAYTDRVWEIAPQLEHLEVLVLACNQPLADPELRRELFAFVEGGGGLLVLHASSWFNWSDWPEYNRELVGGGSRSHAPYGEFEVRLEVTDHPLTDGLPGTFRLRDELYRFEPLPDGAPLRPLATGSAGSDAYPVVLVREGAAGRVVVVTLGHDGEAHAHPAFRRLMRNAASWLSDAAPR